MVWPGPTFNGLCMHLLRADNRRRSMRSHTAENDSLQPFLATCDFMIDNRALSVPNGTRCAVTDGLMAPPEKSRHRKTLAGA